MIPPWPEWTLRADAMLLAQLPTAFCTPVGLLLNEASNVATFRVRLPASSAAVGPPLLAAPVLTPMSSMLASPSGARHRT